GCPVQVPELASRMKLHHQYESLKREQTELGNAPAGGITDKAKSLARQTAISGQHILLNQGIASADKALGKAILALGTDFDHSTLPDALRAKVTHAQKAIADCENAKA